MQTADYIMLAILAPLALIIVAEMGRRGFLRGDALEAGPRRGLDLSPMDLLVVMGLIILGAYATREAWTYLHGHAPEGEKLSAASQLKLTLLNQLLGMFPAAGFVLLRVGMQPAGLRRFGFFPANLKKEIWIAGMAVVAAEPIVMAINALAIWIVVCLGEKPPTSGHKLLESLKESHPPGVVAMMFLSAAIFAPFVEEILYRGLMQTMLQNLLRDRKRWLTITLAAALFAIIHWGAVDPVLLPSLFALGLILGWLYERTGSLWPGMLTHGLFNAINVSLTLMGKS